jgi:hypothetical protein
MIHRRGGFVPTLQLGNKKIAFPRNVSQERAKQILDLEKQRAKQLADFIDRPDYYSTGLSSMEDIKSAAATAIQVPPIIGDIAGLAMDMDMYANDPDSHTWYNYLFTAAGILPGIPAASSVNRAMKKIRAYHGTAGDIKKFDPAMRGSNTKAKSAKEAFWFVDDPEVAGGYARMAAEDAPVQKLIDKSWEAERRGDWDEAHRLMVEAEDLEQSGKLIGGGGQNIVPVDLDATDMMVVDADGASMSDLDDGQLATWVEEAKAAGKRGLKIDNFSDNADYGKYIPATHYAVFDPSDIKPAYRKKGITAYHGSPHDFDEFKMSQIGTGEGAQAYGHGLYFAESEDVARQYKSQLSNALRDKSGAVVPINENDAAEVMAREVLMSKGDYPEAMDSLKQRLDAGFSDELFGAKTQSVLEDWQSRGLKPEGSMYQVEIDATPDEFLDWDKPLSEQSEAIRKVAADNRLEKSQSGLKENTGAGLYQSLGQRNAGADFDSSSLRGADIHANPVLQKAGIKGIRYKDGFSRGAEGGTSNYVVFDDRLISISKRYGIAIPAAAALLAKESGEDTSGTFKAIGGDEI